MWGRKRSKTLAKPLQNPCKTLAKPLQNPSRETTVPYPPRAGHLVTHARITQSGLNGTPHVIVATRHRWPQPATADAGTEVLISASSCLHLF